MVPFEYVIWTAEKCAEYLELSKSRFLRTTRYNNGFPKPVTGDKERPRWLAKEVVAWRINYARNTPVNRQVADFNQVNA